MGIVVKLKRGAQTIVLPLVQKSLAKAQAKTLRAVLKKLE